LEKHYKLGDRVRVVHHGTDIEVFHPRNREMWRDAVRAQLALQPKDCVGLYVGDLQKAMPAAIRGLAKAPGAHLVAVSRTDPAPYAALAASEGVADRVQFVPAASEIAKYYAAADFFVFPTYYDTFGMVVTEAMASGLPVITSRAAGAAELIVHRQSGWLTDEPWNPEQIAEGIRVLASDAGLRERTGAAARSAVESYTWDRTAEETLAVYREVLAEGVR
jgi:UDP-glucose:(heptosyl)LPS alpha-1,3-glucosyltransferase